MTSMPGLDTSCPTTIKDETLFRDTKSLNGFLLAQICDYKGKETSMHYRKEWNYVTCNLISQGWTVLPKS